MQNSLKDDILRFRDEERQERIATGRALLPVLERIDQARANVNTYRTAMESQGMTPDETYTGRDVNPQVMLQAAENKAVLSNKIELAKSAYGEIDTTGWNFMNADIKTKGLELGANKDFMLSTVKTNKHDKELYDPENNVTYADAIKNAKSAKELEIIKSKYGQLDEDAGLIAAFGDITPWNKKDGYTAKKEYETWLSGEGKEASPTEKKLKVKTLVAQYNKDAAMGMNAYNRSLSEAKKGADSSLFDGLPDDIQTTVIIEGAKGNQTQTDAKKFGKEWKINVNGSWYTPAEARDRQVKLIGFPEKPKKGDRRSDLGLDNNSQKGEETPEAQSKKAKPETFEISQDSTFQNNADGSMTITDKGIKKTYPKGTTVTRLHKGSFLVSTPTTAKQPVVAKDVDVEGNPIDRQYNYTFTANGMIKGSKK